MGDRGTASDRSGALFIRVYIVLCEVGVAGMLWFSRDISGFWLIFFLPFPFLHHFTLYLLLHPSYVADFLIWLGICWLILT
jgi:hypothetical protein